MERVALENAQLQHELELLQSVDPLTGSKPPALLRGSAPGGRSRPAYESPLSLVVLDVDGLRPSTRLAAMTPATGSVHTR